MPTISDLITSSLTGIRVARAGDVPNGDDMARGLYLLNRLLDAWNADRRAVYAETFADYVLTPSLSPHTIGVGGTFNVTQRPVSLDRAAVNLGSNVYSPIAVRESDWYAGLTTPALTNAFPTDVYFEPGWPLGKLYFWPVPTTAYSVRLWTRVLLAQVALTDTFTLPPGYQEAIELTLEERMAPSFGQTVSRETKDAARIARGTVFGDNDETPVIATADAGLARGHGVAFNWLNRSMR